MALYLKTMHFNWKVYGILNVYEHFSHIFYFYTFCLQCRRNYLLLLGSLPQYYEFWKWTIKYKTFIDIFDKIYLHFFAVNIIFSTYITTFYILHVYMLAYVSLCNFVSMSVCFSVAVLWTVCPCYLSFLDYI